MRRLKAALEDGRTARHYLLGLDFDGTLAPLALRPEWARLTPENRRLIRRLSRMRRVTVAILTGRALGDIKRKVNIHGLIYVGNHGLEIEKPGGLVWTHPQARRLKGLMQRLAARLHGDLKDFPGVQIENKGLTLSVHYRRLPRYLSPRPIRDMMHLLIDGQKERVRITAGKKVWEIRPRLEWNKGFALRRLLGAPKPNVIAVLVGDDNTDEEGFRSLGHEAITVRVGYRKDSAARFRLKSQKQVKAMLEYFSREWR